MSSKEEECAEYLRSRPGLQRCMEQMKKKWQSYGKAAGNITLHHTSEEECLAIGGILGKRFYEKDIRFSFAEFVEALRKTRYGSVEIQRVLEYYFREKIVTNQEKTARKKTEKQEFLQSVNQCVQNLAGTRSAAAFWCQELTESKSCGYQLLMKEYSKNPDKTLEMMKQISRAGKQIEMYQTSGETHPLAVFAAEVTGDPHYFDRNTTSGQLFIHMICHLLERDVPQTAYQWRKILEYVGIIPDTVSSILHGYGLHLRMGAVWHPAYEAFCKLKQPYVITMENMKGITGARAAGNRVYIVENEMVFSYLTEKMRERDITLLCTCGQPRIVSLLLIPLLFTCDIDVFYSGDIDPDGIRIADRLWQESEGRMHIWRMSPEDYERSCSELKFGSEGHKKLENIKHPELKITAEYMKHRELCGYQENILQDLLTDIK